MKKIMFLIVTLLISSMAFSQLNNDAKAKCKAYAKQKWGTDYSMVEYEYNLQVAAGNEFMEYYDKFGCYEVSEDKTPSDECVILIQAFADWSDEGTGWVQWDMVVYELKKQLVSYYNLKEQ